MLADLGPESVNPGKIWEEGIPSGLSLPFCFSTRDESQMDKTEDGFQSCCFLDDDQGQFNWFNVTRMRVTLGITSGTV